MSGWYAREGAGVYRAALLGALDRLGGCVKMEDLLQEAAAELQKTRTCRVAAEQLEPDLDVLIRAGTLTVACGGCVRRPQASRPAAAVAHLGLTFYNMDWTGVQSGGGDYARR